MDVIREQLISFLTTAQARMTFEEAVEDFPQEHINDFPPHGLYSPYMLLEHIRLTQKDIVDFMQDPEYKEPKWPEDYWPKKETKADEKMWQKSIDGFLEDRDKLIGLIKDEKTDLTAKVKNGTGQTIFREILLVIDHNSWELGEFSLMRQVMSTWPKDRKE
jgi:hypothetical protein